MLTCLSSTLDRSSEVAKTAFKENITLKEACCDRLGYLSADDFDRYCDPAKMIGPSKED